MIKYLKNIICMRLNEGDREVFWKSIKNSTPQNKKIKIFDHLEKYSQEERSMIPYRIKI